MADILKAKVVSIPLKVEAISLQDIGALSEVVSAFLDQMAEQFEGQGAPEDVLYAMQSLTLFFMHQSGRQTILDLGTEAQRAHYVEMEKQLLMVVNSPEKPPSEVPSSELKH